jgi:hypothetical protein
MSLTAVTTVQLPEQGAGMYSTVKKLVQGIVGGSQGKQ